VAGGFAKDGAVQDQIDATVEDGIKRARDQLPRGESLENCEECDAAIPEARREAVPGVRLRIKCQAELYKSLTWDRGKEMADHQRFSLDTDIKVYFCDPRSPWQRGSNENTNGLLRQYFPKGMDLSNIHQNRLNAVAQQLNGRPRKTLNFRTPAERFDQCVASTG